MDRDKLLREAALAARAVAENAMRITRQREVVRSRAGAETLQRAESELEALLERHSRLEEQLIRIQGELVFSG